MRKLTILLSLLSLSLLSSCLDFSPRACDLMLVSVPVTLTGIQLDQSYTLNGRGDTIRSTTITENTSSYVVADDLDREKMGRAEDEYEFHGYVGDSLALVEPYVLRFDDCHIIKVSGRARIEL